MNIQSAMQTPLGSSKLPPIACRSALKFFSKWQHLPHGCGSKQIELGLLPARQIYQGDLCLVWSGLVCLSECVCVCVCAQCAAPDIASPRCDV